MRTTTDSFGTVASLTLPLATGATINLAESPAAVPMNLRELSPTVIFGVPRIWEKSYSRVVTLMSEAGWLGRRLYAAALAVGFSILFGKELASLAFDPAHARLAGTAPRFVERMLLAVVSAGIVASFAAVGSVLVLALLVCPALIAAPHARSVRGQILLSVAIGSLLAAAGYLVAAHADEILGTRTALNSAGMIATLLALAVPCSHLVRAAVNRRSA